MQRVLAWTILLAVGLGVAFTVVISMIRFPLVAVLFGVPVAIVCVGWAMSSVLSDTTKD